ncbi:MAG: pyridoxal phosphate-dependent aminotransferase [Thermaceae bacterium]
MSAFKPHLVGLSRYPYAPQKVRVKLDQNESPFDLPPEVKARALERMAQVAWNRYPSLDAEEVRLALARRLDWVPEGVVVAPGSNLLIQALVQAAQSVLDTAPSFPHYAHAAKLSATPYKAVLLREEGEGFGLDLEALLSDFRGGVLFLPNPHAPTGSLFPREAVLALARRAQEVGGLLVLDEAYREFAGVDHMDLVRENPHVALLRTFSKAWSLGGVRAGYLLGSPEVAAVVQNLLPPFVLPVHTAAILLAVLEASPYVEEVVRYVRKERERLYEALKVHPTWRVYRSHTNFLLVKTPDAQKAFVQLLEHGVLVRRQDHHPLLEGALRVSVGKREENEAFLEAAYAGGKG